MEIVLTLLIVVYCAISLNCCFYIIIHYIHRKTKFTLEKQKQCQYILHYHHKYFLAVITLMMLCLVKILTAERYVIIIRSLRNN